MGCTESRYDISYVEAAIINGENLLIYYEHDAGTLFATHKKHSEGGHISEKKLEEIAVTHQLGLISVEKKKEIHEFYRSIRVGEGYHLRTLAFLVVLLSRGTPSNKAKILFEVADVKKTNTLTKNQVEEIFDDLFDLAVVKLPALIFPSNSENPYTPEELKKTVERMHRGKKVKSVVISEIFGTQETIQEAQFSAWFETRENSEWLRSSGMRIKLKEHGKKHKSHSHSKDGEVIVKEEIKVKTVEEHGDAKAKITVEEHYEESHEHHHRHHSGKDSD